ncbi:MAG: OmpA family protein [Siphonobacter sp.]
MFKVVFLSVAINILLLTCLIAQDRKAQDLYEKGQKALANRDLAAAKQAFEKAVERDETYGEAYFHLGQIAEYTRQLDRAMVCYNKAISLKPQAAVVQPAFLWLGSHYLREGRYQEAAPLIQEYIKSQSAASTPLQKLTLKRANRMLETCRFAQEELKHPLKVEVKRLPQQLNNFESQYFPVLTADRQTLLFTGIEEQNGDENLYVSKYTEELGWSKPALLPGEINTTENEGTTAISADGRTLVFTVCQSRLRRGFGNCDLYVSYRQGDEWTTPENLGPNINSSAWDSQPSLSADGRILFFVSDRTGGIGKRDIWMSRKDSSGQWSACVNAGSAINTADDEVSPFLHANGRTLFFASDGYIGMGGFDLWMSDFDGKKEFTKPVNLGYPLNNHEDQVALYITADGHKGYYAQEERLETDRRQARLWEMDLPESLTGQFKRANVLKGTVIDAVTKKPLTAELEIVNLKTHTLEALVHSDERTGEYAAVLTAGTEYAIFVSRKAYLYKSLSFDYSGANAGQDKVLIISLEAIQKDHHEVLKNVFFESGKWDLHEKSETELQKLIRLLQDNPSVKIEISGHTDDVGDDKRNQELSLKRANAVAEYLTSHGISLERIKTVGLGERKPEVANDSEENRAQNRRIEVKIL